MPQSPEVESFERAFVATTYLLGRREDLVAGLVEPGDAARLTGERLAVPDQLARARRLAAELAKVATLVDARRIG